MLEWIQIDTNVSTYQCAVDGVFRDTDSSRLEKFIVYKINLSGSPSHQKLTYQIDPEKFEVLHYDSLMLVYKTYDTINDVQCQMC